MFSFVPRCARILPAVAVLLLCAAPANAARIHVTLGGTLTSELGYTDFGVDPNLHVGDIFTIRSSFDDSLLTPFGAGGEMIANLYGLPAHGPQKWRMQAGGMTWVTQDELLDGAFGAPSIIIKNNKVVGLFGSMYPTNSLRPLVELDAGGGTFQVLPGMGTYGNLYESQGFEGVWDFAGSQVTSVPEPSTWAMMILGFGLAGSALRRRGRTAARATT